MNIERFAKIFLAHRGTFDMPSRETVAPRRRPTHDVFGRGLFPKCKIRRVMFFCLTFKYSPLAAGACNKIINHTATQLSVVIRLAVFNHVKINGAVAYITKSMINNFLNHADLLYDMPRRSRLDADVFYIQQPECLMKTLGVQSSTISIGSNFSSRAFLATLSSPSSASFSRWPTSVIFRT